MSVEQKLPAEPDWHATRRGWFTRRLAYCLLKAQAGCTQETHEAAQGIFSDCGPYDPALRGLPAWRDGPDRQVLQPGAGVAGRVAVERVTAWPQLR